jgi:hypothetical protein
MIALSAAVPIKVPEQPDNPLRRRVRSSVLPYAVDVVEGNAINSGRVFLQGHGDDVFRNI